MNNHELLSTFQRDRCRDRNRRFYDWDSIIYGFFIFFAGLGLVLGARTSKFHILTILIISLLLPLIGV
ncbi:hypothetical protein BVX93_01515 [bacterium B13(2017)]|nr:hypothetical protein BVX93_01515 [bacterium B13(2017)]